MKTWVRREDLAGLRSSRCRTCGQLIVEVPEVGWIDPDRGDTYDLCPLDPWANHDPDVMQVRPLRPRANQPIED